MKNKIKLKRIVFLENDRSIRYKLVKDIKKFR